MISEFSQMIHCMVLESPISARDLAKAVGKPYSTLLREINPYDSGAKLGVETYFQLLEKTGDLSSLIYVAPLGPGAGPAGYPFGRRMAETSRSGFRLFRSGNRKWSGGP